VRKISWRDSSLGEESLLPVKELFVLTTKMVMLSGGKGYAYRIKKENKKSLIYVLLENRTIFGRIYEDKYALAALALRGEIEINDVDILNVAIQETADLSFDENVTSIELTSEQLIDMECESKI
jgi:hypothetical protein